MFVPVMGIRPMNMNVFQLMMCVLMAVRTLDVLIVLVKMMTIHMGVCVGMNESVVKVDMCMLFDPDEPDADDHQ